MAERILSVILSTQMPPLRLHIAEEPGEKLHALSDKAVTQFEGYLIIFNHERAWPMSTSQMMFPLDIIWLGSDGRVTELVENAKPGPLRFNQKPTHKARCIIKLAGGAIAAYGIKVGDGIIVEGKYTEEGKDAPNTN